MINELTFIIAAVVLLTHYWKDMSAASPLASEDQHSTLIRNGHIMEWDGYNTVWTCTRCEHATSNNNLFDGCEECPAVKVVLSSCASTSAQAPVFEQDPPAPDYSSRKPPSLSSCASIAPDKEQTTPKYDGHRTQWDDNTESWVCVKCRSIMDAIAKRESVISTVAPPAYSDEKPLSLAQQMRLKASSIDSVSVEAYYEYIKSVIDNASSRGVTYYRFIRSEQESIFTHRVVATKIFENPYGTHKAILFKLLHNDGFTVKFNDDDFMVTWSDEPFTSIPRSK
jgi:hypothetical protein